MGHKKRNAVSRSKTSPDAPGFVSSNHDHLPEESDLGSSISGGSESTNPSSSSYASLKLECERALLALRRGNYSKALKLMKDLYSKHKDSQELALINRVQGTVSVKAASIIDDTIAKQRHLKNAIECARKAVSLSPNSLEFAHFYANLLYELANDSKEYEEVVHECKRALAIENPVDPAKESLQDENQQKISVPEARIASARNELQALLQKSSFASITTWVKHLGNGDEKIRLIPIRRVPEDPMELKSVQARRPNEIKKVVKTPEERRKEIEVRVAAARLLQQKSESPHLTSEGDINNINRKKSDSGPGPGQRAGERRKSGNMRRTGSSDGRSEWVRSYWNSVSFDEQEDLLRIRVSDIRKHFSLPKDGSLSDVLNEALCFGEAHKSWRFWMCCRCHEKYADASSFMQHVEQEHVKALLPKPQSVLPQNVENGWAEMLLNCSWKPLDLNAAIRMLEKHPKSISSDAAGSKECFIDNNWSENELNSFSGKRKSGDNCNGSVLDSGDVEHIEWMDCVGDRSHKETLLHENWPVSDDPERAKLLEGIRSIFEALVKHQYLASSHLSKVINFAVEELLGMACGSQLIPNMDQTPLCICFLGTEELKKILNFLQEISQSCGLDRSSDKSSVRGGSSTSTQIVDSLEKIMITQDASFLVFDEHFPPFKIPAVNDVSTPSMLPHVCHESGVVLDVDTLLSWIYPGASIGEQFASWKRKSEEKSQQGLEILQLLEKEVHHLQSLCERKSEHSSYEEALQTLEDLCLEEGKKREHSLDFVCLSYDAVLKRRREELIDNDTKITENGNKFELDAVTNVLKNAGSLNVNQFGIEETYNGVSSNLCDLESGEDGGWRMKDYLHQADSCIEVAIQRQKEQVSIEISKIDARIMRVVADMQQLEVNLEPASSCDFQLILVPLMKSYIRARLEDLAEKDATEKSDAAREAFLAELAQDSRKGVAAAFDSSKHSNEKAKDRRKNKENPKSKDLKVTYSDEFQDKTAEKTLLTSACDEDGHDSRIAVPGPDDVLRLQEEYKRRIELEAEERKLEETLEYQRRIENEAKQKHLAELHIKTNVEKAETVVLADDYLSHCNEEDHATEQLTSRKDTLMQEYGFHKNLEGLPNNSTNGGMMRTGRRGRRQKRSNGLRGGGSLPVSPEKEDIDNSQPRSGQNSHDKDDGAKTSRQLQAEDDEERFQADLKKAVCQSLDVGNGIDTYGMGLKNEVGEYNCFLNVIIQSLWHLKRFRDELLWRSASGHVHVGDPCVVCALCDILSALSMASKDNRREAVAPTSLRIALSNLYPESNFFQEGQMNDASEVLGVIFDCLHQSFAVAPIVSDMESVDVNCMGSWDCNNVSCIAHSNFGMNIFERMNCYNCGLESRHLKYTSFFHNINASALRTMKVMYPEYNFDELLNMVEMNHLLACDIEAGGCGKLNYIHHILSAAPHVFATVLGWQNTSESIGDITATLAALSTEVDISSVYRGLDPQNRHCLGSVVCYYGQHYHCFAYSHDHNQWIMYDDKTVKVIGGWNDVVRMCERGRLQPQLLLYEAVN